MELRLMYNEASVGALANAIVAVYPPFAREPFLAAVFAPGWDDLALKQRTRRITTALHDFLPADYAQALDILRRALPLLGEQGFEKMVFPDYVECYGLDHLEVFTDALRRSPRKYRPSLPSGRSSTATRRRQWPAWRNGPGTPTPACAASPAKAAARACPGEWDYGR